MRHQDQDTMNQHLAQAAGRVATDLAERRATAEKHARYRRGPGLGDTFFFRRTAGQGVEWAVVERRPDDGNLLVLPFDDFPFVGSRDVELPAASLGGLANVRCDVGVWLEPSAFRRERRTGALPAEDLERVRVRRLAVLDDRLEPDLLEDEADNDPEYQRWRSKTLSDAVAQLREPVPVGKVLRLRRAVRRWTPRLAMAASVALAVWLAIFMNQVRDLEDAHDAVRQRAEESAAARNELEQQLDASETTRERLDAELQEMRESSETASEELRSSRAELADREARIAELSKTLNEAHPLPFVEMKGLERQRSSRGQPEIIPLGNAPFLALALEVEDPEPYLRYRLRIARRGTDVVVWETDDLVKQGRWLSLVLPSGFFESETQYELHLAGLMGERIDELEEEYLVMIRR